MFKIYTLDVTALEHILVHMWKTHILWIFGGIVGKIRIGSRVHIKKYIKYV